MHVKNHMAMAADTMNIDMNKNSMDTMHMDEDMTMNHVVIDITGENFAFSMDEITVNKWDKVTINFESTDWFHDWVVDEFDAATEQVRPWTMTSVTFMADEAGMYEYYCSVGSHRAQGMVGTLIVEDTEMMDEKHMMKMDMLKNANTLEHVAIWQTIRGISFDGSETARAATMTTDGMTHVYAEFMNLPDLDENNFYEWWAVRKSPFDFISTGELMMKDWVYINDWMSDGDYSEYTHYVLTLEPRDNDPAPAEHIFEWDM